MVKFFTLILYYFFAVLSNQLEIVASCLSQYLISKKYQLDISSIYMTALYEELIKSGKKCEKVRKIGMHLSS